jgi:hypothetical protein
MDLRKDILYYDALVDFPTNGQENKLYLNKADGALYYWDGSAYSLAGDGSGGVTSVTASAPLASSGGAIPNISLTIPSDNTKFLDGSGTFDTVKDSDLSLSDITTNDVSTSKHGFAPKAPNDTAKFLRGDGTWAVPASGSSSGRFGIADSNGEYTFYTTLTLAMTAASAGQTIELFADYTESGATTITLKNNVTINGNGHTYTHTSTTGNTFNFVAGATVYINNLIINRTVTTPTGAAVFYFDNSFGNPMRLRCSAVYVNYTFTSSVGATPVVTADALTQYIVEGLNATANGSGAMFSQSGQPITIIDCFARNTGTGNGYAFGSAGGTIDDSYASVVSGTGIALTAGSSARNCNSIATTGVGISGAGNAYQCYAFSNTNYAYNSVTAYNCVAQTTSGTAFYNCIIRNCSGTSTTGAALAAFFSPAYAYNSSLQSTGGVTIPSSPWSMLLENCSITNEWNNASGHAVTFGSSGSAITNDITNCKITVSNASANCLNVASAINAKYANNVFKGATTPVNANITQTISNTHDSQGNILM